jgi:hypothetical protein
MGAIYEYDVEMGSGAITYIPSVIKIGSGIQKLMRGGGYTGTKTGWKSHKKGKVVPVLN